MKYNFRTDLAIETREAYQKATQNDIPGVDVTTDEKDDVKITRVKVVNEEGANEIGKPIGNYITLEVPKIEEDDPEVNEKIYKILAKELKTIIGENKNEAVLVVGLGNSNVTPDALGPKVISYLEVTRHIIEFAPEYKLEFRCEEEMIEEAVKAIKDNHPYEEVCINVIEVLAY